jgi:hypothetical protein
MASQAHPAKVLRIGIIQDGKIVQERLIKAGETVNVGESAKNTFVFPKTSLPRAEFPLFVAKGGAYHLNFTKGMKGKISSGGAVVGLDKLRKDPSVARQGDVWRLPLTEQDRGKIALDNITVLFQYVPPPPVQAIKPMEGMDFRPKWVDEDDPAFFGFLALWAALAVIFAVFVWLAPRPPAMTFADIEDRFANLIVQEKPDKVEEIDKPIEDEEPDRTEEDKTKAKAVDEKPKTKVQKIKDREDRKEALKSKIKIARIGTRGKSSGGTTSDAYESGVLNELDSVDGGVVVDGPGGPKSGDVDSSDASIEGLKTGDAGDGTIGAGPQIDLSQYTMDKGSGDVAEVEGAESVEKVVSKRASQLQYCYEEQLRADTDLSGRVEVYWNIAGGRITAVNVEVNTTGNDSLANCIVKKVKRWRFDADVNGPVTCPFVFRKKG